MHCGAKSRTRTGDPRVFSAMLYQLSYLGKPPYNVVVGDDGFEPPTPSV
jgi:precorrin-4 methylase